MSASKRSARPLGWIAAALVFGALTSATPHARAASDAATAEALFTEARGRMAHGDYAAACPELEESQRLDPGMGTLFNLGDCYEHLGRTASAWAAFLDVASQAKSQNQPAREADARARAAALAPKLAHLSLVVPAEVAKTVGLVVKRDDIDVGKPQWGLVLPIDPGDHVVTATAPGKRPWTTPVSVAPGAKVSLELPVLVAATSAAAPEKSAPERTSFGAQRAAGVAALGVGVAALAVGSIEGLMSMSKKSDGDKNCSGAICNAQGVSDRDDARAAGNVSTVAFIVGGAMIAAGVLLYVLAPKTRTTTTAQTVLGPAGVGGTFW